MKKALTIPLLFLLIMTVQSCQKGMKDCEGRVEEINGTTSMVVTVDGDSVKFDIDSVDYTNGAVMVGDSVKVGYVGDLDERKVRAVTVSLIQKKGHVVNAGFNPDSELKTRSMDSITKERFDEFVESASKDI